MTADEMKEYRRQKGWSQARLAEEVEVSIHAVQSWEQEKNPIPKIVEKHLRSQTEISIPLDLIMQIQAFARAEGGNFDQALFALIRKGLANGKAKPAAQPPAKPAAKPTAKKPAKPAGKKTGKRK